MKKKKAGKKIDNMEKISKKKRVDKKIIKKKYLAIAIGIILVLATMFIIKNIIGKNASSEKEDDFFKCLSQRTTLYMNPGCSYCINQEKILGENIKSIKIIDCSKDYGKCSQIRGTPTWIINGNQEIGVKTLDQLKALSGC